jgi:hypothetical protein
LDHSTVREGQALVLSFAGSDIFAGIAPTGGADTVTCQKVSAILEIGNAQYSENDDIINPTTTGASASPTSTSLTTLVPNEILVSSASGWTLGTLMTANSPFTGLFAAGHGPDGDMVITITGYTLYRKNRWSSGNRAGGLPTGE